ncbi:MAG: UxaA family hydrolase [Geminicoccaceae bacterium]
MGVPAVLRLAPDDDVAVALRALAEGEEIELDGRRLTVLEPVPLAHKLAVRPIPAGQRIRKHGFPIGTATCAIDPGRLVHVHNIRSDYIVNDVDHAED